MTPLNIARAAKMVALLGFLLPWVLVSCSTTPVAKATGVQLAMGQMTSLMSNAPPQSGEPNWWVVAAAVLIVIGLAVSFLKLAQAQRGWAILATSIAALVCCWVTLTAITASAQQQGAADPSAQQMAAMIRVEAQSGYWVTVVSLLIAAGVGGLIALGRDGMLTGVLSQVSARAKAAAAPVETPKS